MTQTMGRITRDNYDSFWLQSTQASQRYTKFKHVALREKAGVRAAVKPVLIQAVVDHHIHYTRVAESLRKYGYLRTAALLKSRLPRDHKTRMGNFGEVVATEHLRQNYGYEMPIFKLRFADSFNLPMRGEDGRI